MDRSVIPSILRELNLNEERVANIYNYGSWTYGTNSLASDRDLLIVTRASNSTPLVFHEEFDYFHQFELHKLWNKYDVCVHTAENFEILLEKNYLVAIECTFLPTEFKIKEEIDFRQIYLEKYYDTTRLKTVAFYENSTAIKMYDLDDDSIYPTRSTTIDDTSQSSRDYLFKNLFHGLRYLDFAQQLIETKSIHDFKRVSHILETMKQIRGDPIDDSKRADVLAFVVEQSTKAKAKLNTLVPTNTIKGTFEVHVTFDCTHRTDEVIEKLQKLCEKSKYKIIFIDLHTGRSNDKLQQLMTSSYHCGEYPSIVTQIEEEVYQYFQEFNIMRVKIESLASNEGVPEQNIEKNLFWDHETNYFEFHYKILLKKTDELNKLVDICRNYYTLHLHLSRNAFKKMDNDACHYLITMRLFDMGRAEAFEASNEVTEYLTQHAYPPLKVVREFVVYDNHIELDAGWN